MCFMCTNLFNPQHQGRVDTIIALTLDEEPEAQRVKGSNLVSCGARTQTREPGSEFRPFTNTPPAFSGP